MTGKRFKISTAILSVILAIIVLGVFPSNIILKNEYNKLDKSDPYWDYDRILEQPFSHVRIDGSSIITGISFQQNSKPSVRVASNWDEKQRSAMLKVSVKNDTLFINFLSKSNNRTEQDWMKRNRMLRLFAPHLLSVTANNVDMEINKFTQNDLNLDICGKSKFEVENYKNHLGNIKVNARDSSMITFEMVDDFKGPHTMTFDTVTANLKGLSALNIGYGFANKLNLSIEDGSAIVLSGKSLRKLKN